MKHLAYTVAVICILTGCFKTTVNTAQDPRPMARAAVDLAKDAWVLAATACLQEATAANDDTTRAKCEAALTPAHDLIESAAEAVDTAWDGNAACGLFRATTLVSVAVKDLHSSGILTTIQDAVKLAAQLTSATCEPSDAGSSG